MPCRRIIRPPKLRGKEGSRTRLAKWSSPRSGERASKRKTASGWWVDSLGKRVFFGPLINTQLYKVYMGLIMKGPPSQGFSYHFPFTWWLRTRNTLLFFQGFFAGNLRRWFRQTYHRRSVSLKFHHFSLNQNNSCRDRSVHASEDFCSRRKRILCKTWLLQRCNFLASSRLWRIMVHQRLP